MSTTPITSASGLASAAAAASPSSTSSTSGAANEDIFLQLLVAQLKYQDPSNPASGTEFVTQLATFSQLQEDQTVSRTHQQLQQRRYVLKENDERRECCRENRTDQDFPENITPENPHRDAAKAGGGAIGSDTPSCKRCASCWRRSRSRSCR